jgi:RNA polymerase sigma-70 factor (ECF subfamily)
MIKKMADSDEAFERERPRLLSLAYRMLGSAAEAEDVLQETWLRRQTAAEEIRSERAWLNAVVTRLCLDQLRAAQTRRAAYEGTWLPEPVATDGAPDRERISLAFLAVLERLSPAERAVYLLHDVFDFSYAEIAPWVEKSEAACRQLGHRAREHVEAERPRFSPSQEKHQRLVQAFLTAVERGEVEALRAILAADVTLYGDGGGKAPAVRKPLQGAEAVATFFARLIRIVPPGMSPSLSVREINGWPAVLFHAAGRVVTVMTLETDGERIRAIRNVLNPDKLGRIEPGVWSAALKAG